MRTIWKFSTLGENVEFKGKFEIVMPKGAEILCVQRDEKKQSSFYLGNGRHRSGNGN